MAAATSMRDRVPDSVARVCQALQDAGHQGWIVGGAVRDLVLGKTPSDWDVASDALPDVVVELFPRTIATGLQHGTVTVMVGSGGDRKAVEVTTFRGEGAYSDARRPDSVHFGVPLDEDLQRRDFVINAMAFDPLADVIHDPFGGVGDLEAGIVRAVGVPEERFAEDGLRVMRAVRFVSALDFELDPATEAGLETALGALARVAAERIRVELIKLLGGQAPGRALDIAARRGVLGTILPELAKVDVASAGARIQALPADPVLRLAALLVGAEADLDELLRRLTMSNEERQRVVRALSDYEKFPEACESPLRMRQHLSRVGREGSADQIQLWGAQAALENRSPVRAGVRDAQRILAEGVPLEVRDLAVKGGQVMAVTGLRGPRVGEVLRELLERVLEDPGLNERGTLEALARELPSGGESSSEA